MVSDEEGDWVKAEARRLAEEDGREWNSVVRTGSHGRYIDRAYKALLEKKKSERDAHTGLLSTPTGVNRHPEVEHLLSLFEYKHLPLHLQPVSRHCSEVANDMANRLEDGYELIAGLRHLLYAKDAFVRQAVVDHREES